MAEIIKNKNVRQYIEMTIGIIMMAVGVYFFKIPNGFSTLSLIHI